MILTRKFSFSNRVIDAWNSLPALCVNSAAINCFKTNVSVCTAIGDCYVKLAYLQQWAIYGASLCSLMPSASSSTDVGGNGESGEPLPAR